MQSVNIQKYEQMERLGSGGQGSVYKAERRADGSTFAMKNLEATTERKHKQNVKEVQHMLKLSHKNLVPCLDYFETINQQDPSEVVLRVHIVMPLYARGDLASLVETEGPLSQKNAARLLRDMSNALEYIHNEGFIHGDVKPHNIMVDAPPGNSDEMRFILADLGLTREVSLKNGTDSTIAGTPAFMAPDYRSKNGYTNKVDMWALGVTMCQVVIQEKWKKLFFKYLLVNWKLVMSKLQVQLPAIIGTHLSEVVLNLLSKDPVDRPTSSEVLQRTEGTIVLLAVGSLNGEEWKRKICVGAGAGAEEVRLAATKVFSKGGELLVRRLEVFNEDFKEFISVDDRDAVFEEKGRIRVVFESRSCDMEKATGGSMMEIKRLAQEQGINFRVKNRKSLVPDTCRSISTEWTAIIL